MQSRSFQIVAVFLVVIGLGVVRWAPRGRAESDLAVRNTLVGAWQLVTDDADPDRPRALAVFTADGTYLQYDVDGMVAVGTWAPVSAHAAALTVVSYRGDNSGHLTGGRTMRGLAETNDGGERLTMIYTVQSVDATGAETGEQGPITATGALIAVEPVPQEVATVVTP